MPDPVNTQSGRGMRRFIERETHFYLGQPYRLVSKQGPLPYVKLVDNTIQITLPTMPAPKQLEAALYGWYAQRALKLFPERLDFCLKPFQERFSFPLPKLHIRRMRSLWGSCSSRGKVTLNLELIRAPIDCLDQVITHEICHLWHPNHGRGFYELFTQVMPDHPERKIRLNQWARSF